MSLRFALILVAALLLPDARAGDWPTFQHDGRRSGLTAETLDFPLHEAWTYTARHAPRPAWPPPARADFWHHKSGLNPRVTFDRAFHVAVADGLLFFGSSADDTITCLDAATGEEQWAYFTGGPVRLAPTVWEGRVYAGSDDGVVYCLDAAGGRLLWSYRPAGLDRCVIGHGRMISAAPVRTGVLIEDGTAYCCAGLFPSEGVHLAALDARTGDVRWERPLDLSPQGYMLASADRLYVPTGRTAPAVFSRGDGSLLGTLEGSVGAYALVTDDFVLHGPGDTGQLALSSTASRDHLATFPGLRMIVREGTSFLQSKTWLSAFDRVRYLEILGEQRALQARIKVIDEESAADRAAALNAERKQAEEGVARCGREMAACILWEQPCMHLDALILANDTLVAGGGEGVAAFGADDGALLWQAQTPGRAYGLAAAGGRLYVSTDEGAIHCFGVDDSGADLQAAAGGKAPATSSPEAGEKSDAAATIYSGAAEWILARAGISKGFCLVLGCGEGRLAAEIARMSEMTVVAVDADAARVEAARRMLDRAGLHGVRVSILQAEPGSLPFPDFFANLIVSEEVLVSGRPAGTAAEVHRLLHPEGGLALIGQSVSFSERSRMDRRDLETWLGDPAPAGATILEQDGLWAEIRRGPLAGAGEWTHTYAEPANTACSNDAYVRGPLELQWFGRPGPRLMIDRHHRNVPPLYKNGRIFIPGDERVFVLDAYNGTWLWDKTIPDSRRLGVFLDTSHMVVDDERLYAAHGSVCSSFDAATGEPSRTYTLPRTGEGEDLHWGYVARTGRHLLGSGRLPEASYTETSYAADAALWYDSMSIVTSRSLFALDRDTGRKAWTYRSGIIINPTITIGGGRVFFVETNSPKAVENAIGRMPGATFLEGDANFLVALDLDTGRTVYRKKVDLTDCRLIAYLNYADGILLLSGCEYRDRKLWYSFLAMDAATGEPRWQQSHNSGFDPGGGHGEQNRHPTIVGDTVYTYPYAYRLKTGERIEGYCFDRAGHGCGGVSASTGALFWRGGNPAMRDLEPGSAVRKINRVTRPGCWINMIPAGGLLLIPEASSGCTCSFPLQASMAYRPAGGP